jgi:hypothetical protein
MSGLRSFSYEISIVETDWPQLVKSSVNTSMCWAWIPAHMQAFGDWRAAVMPAMPSWRRLMPSHIDFFVCILT